MQQIVHVLRTVYILRVSFFHIWQKSNWVLLRSDLLYSCDKDDRLTALDPGQPG